VKAFDDGKTLTRKLQSFAEFASTMWTIKAFARQMRLRHQSFRTKAYSLKRLNERN